MKSYSELISIPDYLERYRYLRIGGAVGAETFGMNRYLNQALYMSPEWKTFRRDMIIRDLGCDMAFAGMDINGPIYLHHINPIKPEDVMWRSPMIFDPENVVCVAWLTHQAIHYGNESLLPIDILVERRPNDTCPWRQ